MLEVGIVHHDIKLSNILIPNNNALDELILIDFGLASIFNKNNDLIND